MTPSPPYPDPTNLDPIAVELPAGTRLFRCHDGAYGATEFSPGEASARFSPVLGADGKPVPVLYAAETFDAVVAETAFRNVPVRGAARRVFVSTLVSLVVSEIETQRPITVVQLYGFGLARLGVTRPELIDSDTVDYPGTQRWSQALYDHDADLAGLSWMARQHDTSRALMFYGDRVASTDFVDSAPALALAFGRGLGELFRVAEEAGITVVS